MTREGIPVKLRQYQQDAIDMLRARLDVNDGGHAAHSDVTRALASPMVRSYIYSYVLSILDMLEGKGYYGQREAVSREVRQMRLRRDATPPKALKTLADIGRE